MISNLNRALLELGYQPAVSLKDLHQAHQFFDLDADTLVQAPVWQPQYKTKYPVRSLADALMLKGYRDVGTLKAMVMAWRHLMEMFQVNVLFSNYAPTAQLAARSLGLPIITVTSGFALEPAGKPCICWQTFEPLVQNGLSANEERCLDTVNQVRSDLGMPEQAFLSDINLADVHIFHHLAELDIYAGFRSGEAIYQPFSSPPINESIRVKDGSKGAVILAYLVSYYPKLDIVLEALCRIKGKVIVSCPGLPVSKVAEWQERGLEIYNQLLNLDVVLPQAQLVIGNGGIGIVSQALSHGVPFLGLPFHMENLSNCKAAQGAGVGEYLARVENPDEVAAFVMQCLKNTCIREQCEKLRDQNTDKINKPLTESLKQAISMLP